MNILMLTTHLNAGGITSYLLTLSKGLRNLGHQVHVASSGGNMERDFREQGVHLCKLNIRTKSELDPRIYLALGSLRKYIESNAIDVIHAQTRITQVMGAILDRTVHKPYVATCHGYFKARLSRRWAPCWGRRVIAISQAVEKHLRNDFQWPKEKIVLIPSGIDLNEFTPADETQRMEGRKRFALGRDPVIGMIARLSDVKGPDVLIEAMVDVKRDHQNAKLVLVGEGRMERSLRAQANRLNMEENIRFFTAVNQTKEMLSLFDVFVMPSRQEGLGLSIMEAQAMCLPVIASRVGGIPSLIAQGETGIMVEPEDPKALAKAITTLLQSEHDRKRLGHAGREFITRNHSMDAMAQQTLSIYQSVLTG